MNTTRFAALLFAMTAMSGCQSILDGPQQVIYIPTSNGVEAQTVSLGNPVPSASPEPEVADRSVSREDLSGHVKRSFAQGYAKCRREAYQKPESVGRYDWSADFLRCLEVDYGSELRPDESISEQSDKASEINSLVWEVVTSPLETDSASIGNRYLHLKEEMRDEYLSRDASIFVSDTFAYLTFKTEVFTPSQRWNGLEREGNPWFSICGNHQNSIRRRSIEADRPMLRTIDNICRHGGGRKGISKTLGYGRQDLWGNR